MIDAQSQAALQDIIRQEGRSLLQYLSEAFPWTADSERGQVEKLKELAEEESKAVATLLGYMRRKRVVPPSLTSYPMNFTTLNYVSLDYLLPILIEHEGRRISDLESALPKVEDSGAKAHLKDLVAMKQRHKGKLESLLRTNAGETKNSGQSEQNEPEAVPS